MTRQKNGLWKLTDEEMLSFAIYASEAKERYSSLGMEALKTEANKCSEEIHDKLDEIGYFD